MAFTRKRKNAPGLAAAIEKAGGCQRLARKLDLPYQTVAHWKYTRVPPRELPRICKLLKMKRSDFDQDMKREDL